MKIAKIEPFAEGEKMLNVVVQLNGELTIASTETPAETLNLLDRAMEAIDGHRLPPEGS